MNQSDNFERAKKLTDNWPSWKQNYQLTKDSKVRQKPSALEKQTIETNKKNTIKTSHVVECEV